MKIISIIPARMSSTRFPGKPMKDILGLPMIGHVYKRVKMCKSLLEVYVATCDEVIFDYIESIGGKAIMTSDKHERCTDRCAEAMEKIEIENQEKCDIMVMVQGDEPLTYPEMIDSALEPMINDKNLLITNLFAELNSVKEFENANDVKVVMDRSNNALYFSREPIPSKKKSTQEVPMNKQVPIIPFKRNFLLEYNKMEQTPLEKVESVDMLRILENGIKIKMVKTNYHTKAVDTQQDLDLVSEIMQIDKLFKKYQ